MPQRARRSLRRQQTLRPCQACQRIRLFVAFAAVLIIGLPLAGGNLEIAKILTPWHFAAVIPVLGLCVLALKLLEARREPAAPTSEEEAN